MISVPFAILDVPKMSRSEKCLLRHVQLEAFSLIMYQLCRSSDCLKNITEWHYGVHSGDHSAQAETLSCVRAFSL